MSTFSQKNWSRQDKQDFDDADFAFYQGDYVYALQLLEPLYTKDSTKPALNYIYAASLFELNRDEVLCMRLFRSASEQNIPEAIFYYARALHHNYEFEAAIFQFSRYKEIEKKERSNDEVERYIQTAVRAKKMVAEPVDVNIRNLGPKINTADKEYVPVISGDNEHLYYTSRKQNGVGGLKDPNGEYFEDIYYSQSIKGEWTEAVNVGEPINTGTHDATVAISSDGNTMIVYRTNKKLTGGDLYLTHQNKGIWGEPKLLGKRINSEYQEASACISSDNQTLYFSSNRPGGFGGKDLYRVKMLPNGEWSLPKNLGPNVNSKYDEDAPFIDANGHTLYFASNGIGTMGGYDVFKTEYIDGVWASPESLGYPINTVNDDIYLSLDAGGRTGYYSSDQENGFGQLDIYKVDFIYRQQKTLVIKGEIMDLMEMPMKASITVIDENTREIQGIYNSNSKTGKFILVLNPLTNYKVLIEAKGYAPVFDEIYFEFPEDDGFEFRITPYMLIENR